MTRRTTPLILAFALLTTLPVGRWLPARIRPADQGRSVVCYPLVGLAIGMLLVLADAVLHGAPLLLDAAMLLAVWVIATGALHLDGLADCVDAWFAGHGDPSRTLTVMKEPTAGPAAVVALVLLLLIKFAALVALLREGAETAGLLLIVPLLARAAVAGLIAVTAYRRADGIARDQAATRPRRAIALAVLGSAAVGACAVPSGLWLLLLVAVAVVTWAWRSLWQRRIGGYTGDVAGALIELVEAALLLTAAWSLPWG